MEPTYDSRKSEGAATEKTAVTGGNGTKEPARGGGSQSSTPRSWRQYVEQSLPAEPAAEREDVKPNSPDVKKEARAALNRWAKNSGEKARSAAAAVREKLDDVTADGRETLGDITAGGRETLGDITAGGRETLGDITAGGREKLSGAANLCRETLVRGAEKVRAAVARHPISPLLYATLLAVVIGVVAFKGNYARAYVLEVNDQEVGLVSGEDEVNAILDNVRTRAASVLGDDFSYDVDVTLSPVYAAPDALTDAAEMEDALFEEVGAYMTAWAISVDGVELGYATDSGEFYRMLDEIAQPYLPENAVRYEFIEDVQVYPVELPSNTKFTDLEPIREELSALRTEEAVYVVKKGDTFNAIAYSLDMNPNDLAALNPDVIVNKLWVDQELIIQQAIPRLSVVAFTDETYEDIVPSPVEYIETADLYVGSTKVKEQGEDGLALVNARVTYLNNVEQEREIVESTTLKEPTTTYTYTGTTPRPATASNGYFIWPVQGTITSTFGYRYIFGSTSYHSGLDISVPYGTTVKAADGGKVTFAGSNGAYGNLVIITHDDGTQTYYAHNSSLLVSVGQRVYQGQAIAKAGSTGRSTGPHCHFEVRINGTAVNPRNYLK